MIDKNKFNEQITRINGLKKGYIDEVVKTMSTWMTDLNIDNFPCMRIGGTMSKDAEGNLILTPSQKEAVNISSLPVETINGLYESLKEAIIRSLE